MGEGRNRERKNRRKQGGKDVVLFAQGEAAARPEVVVCCVDDTDDLTGETSTGHVAEMVAARVAALGGRVRLGITRHQLLLAEGVPYTSHNSAMAFVAELPAGGAARLREAALEALARWSAPAADPGLCVAVLPAAGVVGEAARQVERLRQFGVRAQRELCSKEEAYALAASVPWVRLSEHGGTGDGVIGALAGAGLRLGGQDGRFRGQWNLRELLGDVGDGPRPARGDAAGANALAEPCEERGDAGDGARAGDVPAMAVGELRARLGALVAGPVRVVDAAAPGMPLVPDDALLRLSERAKPALVDGALTFAADFNPSCSDAGSAAPGAPEDSSCPSFYPACSASSASSASDVARANGASGVWVPRESFEGRAAGTPLPRTGGRADCERFAWDNDGEECAPDLAERCDNCLYRRWTANGFTCEAL